MKNAFTISVAAFWILISSIAVIGFVKGPSNTKAARQAFTTTVQGEIYDFAYIGKHNTKDDCWLVIDKKIYSVSQYMPFHPGGVSAILSSCGKDATIAFNTKGVQNRPHSNEARAALEKYYIADIDTPVPVATASADSQTGVTPGNTTPLENAGVNETMFVDAQIVAIQDVSVRKTAGVTGQKLGVAPLGTQGKVLATERLSDGSFWVKVRYDNGQIGWSLSTLLSTQLHSTNTPGASVKPFQTTGAILTSATVATHNTSGNCWLIINNNVYNVTDYIPFHPGGVSSITNYCGKEATTAFNTKGGGGSHSTNAKTLLAKYLIGALGVVAPKLTPAPVPPGPVSPPAAAGDTQAPTLVIVQPVSGATLTTDTKIVVTASDADGIASVAFKVDTKSLRTDTTSPYSTNLVLANYGNGPHTVIVIATDKTGRAAEARAQVTFSTDTNTVTPVVSASLSAGSVATHTSASDCWIIVNNNVYNVTDYIPFHPGGVSSITNYCGKEATTAFNTKGGGGSHSTNAKTLLAKYLIGALGGASPTPTPTPTPPPPPPPGTASCTTFTYSAWGSCQSNNAQTRTVNTSSPTGCTGGNPVTSQACTYTPPATGGLTLAQVATHNTSANCYLIISGKVYNVTQYIPFHPGGTSAITNRCGTDATTVFNTNSGGGHNHSNGARTTLAGYYVGDLVTTSPTPTPTPPPPPPPGTASCTTFTYSAWGSCQSNNAQTRTVNTSSPTGCTGGNPVTSQACTYTPSTASPQTYTVSVAPGGGFTPATLSIAVGDSIRFSWTSGDEVSVSFSPTTIQGYKLDHENSSFTRAFSSAGTWTFSANGSSGSVTVN